MKMMKRHIPAPALFLILTAAAGLVTLILAMVTKGTSLEGLYFVNANDPFMDLFNPLSFVASGDPYSNVAMGAFYPPLCYMLYELVYSWVPFDMTAVAAMDVRSSRAGMMIAMLLTILVILALVFCAQRCLSVRGRAYADICTVIMIFSAPFIYQYERANILAISLILLLVFAIGRNSETPWIREASYIALALAAAIKLYPAVFGLILLIEKKWKDAARCVLYGIAAFVLPFFYYGGLGTMFSFINNLLYATGATGYAQTGVGYRIDLQTGVSLIKWIAGKDGSYLPPWYTLFWLLCLLLMAAGAVFIREQWKKLLCITVMLVILPPFNYEYAGCFYAVPLLFFLRDAADGGEEYLYAVLFAGIFAPLTMTAPYLSQAWQIPTAYPLTLTVFVQNMSQLIMIVVIAVDLVKAVRAAYGKKAFEK